MKSILGAVKLVLVFVMAFFARKSGKDAVLATQAKDSAKRAEKGRQAAGKASQDIRDGKSPDDVVRDNDGAWG